MRRYIGAAAIVAGVLSFAGPAGADTQTITANVNQSLSITGSPTTTISGWSLEAIGNNERSGGSITVSSNVPYTVNVSSDQVTMSEYDTQGNSYVANGKAMTSPLSIVAVRSGGDTAVPGVGASAASGAGGVVASGGGLGSDTYDITLRQTTALRDPRLGANRTYRMVLTYSAASAL